MYAILLTHDQDESAVLRVILQRAGFASRLTTEAKSIPKTLAESHCDLILLSFKDDIPNKTVQLIRSNTDIPIAIISNPVNEEIQILALQAGADLLIARPYSVRLLITQLRGLIRRASGMPIFSLPSFTVGDLTLDPSIRTIQVKDEGPKHLTRLEFRMMYTLMMHAGQTLATESLVEEVWGFSGRGDRDLVRGLIKRLRAKVELEPSSPIYIKTIPGVGYILVKPISQN